MKSLILAINYFISLSDEDENLITKLFTRIHLPQDGYFLQEGNVCRHVAFIDQGLVRYFINNDGNERTMYFNKENEFVSNYQSFLSKTVSHVSIQALEPTTLYTISYENLQRLYSEIKEGERFGRLAVEEIYLAAMHQLNSLYTDTPTNRYQYFLTAFRELTQRIPQYYIASYVGIKPQSLSRIRKRISTGH
ncbi:Crp/Fnr family transcriptional regulator [Pedobacter sp. NJ-S-72]